MGELERVLGQFQPIFVPGVEFPMPAFVVRQVEGGRGSPVSEPVSEPVPKPVPVVYWWDNEKRWWRDHGYKGIGLSGLGTSPHRYLTS